MGVDPVSIYIFLILTLAVLNLFLEIWGGGVKLLKYVNIPINNGPSGYPIKTQFCTCHDNTAVVACWGMFKIS